ncbi:DMT family transporter [Streptoalloteichus hindustanus]|nr:DMT family transporter [Streptoalloteichus hindustanus]
MTKGRPAGVVLAATTAMTWGGLFVVSAGVLPELDVVHMTLVRYLFSALLTAALLLAVEGRRAFRTDGRGLLLFVLGSIGYAGYNVAALSMIGPLPAQSVSVLVATMPLVATAVSWAAGGGRPRPVLGAAALLALLGVATVLGRGAPLAVLDGAVGLPAVVVLFGVLSWVVFTRGANRFPDWSPLRYTALTQFGGVVTLMLVTVVAEAAGWVETPRLSTYLHHWPALLYMTVPASVYAVLAWNSATRRLGPPTTSLFITLVPVTALTVTALGGVPVTAGQLVGVALVLAALVAGVLGGTRRPATTPSAPAPRPEEVPKKKVPEEVPATASGGVG